MLVDVNHFISAPDSRILHSSNCLPCRLAGAKCDIHLTFHMELKLLITRPTSKLMSQLPSLTVLCYTQQLQAMKLSLLADIQRLSTL